MRELGTEAAGPASAATFKCGMSELIVSGAFLLVLQDFVGLIDLFEALFRLAVTGIAIRVILHRQLAIRRFELTVACPAIDSENVVIVSLGHRCLKFPVSGRDRHQPPCADYSVHNPSNAYDMDKARGNASDAVSRSQRDTSEVTTGHIP